MRVALPLFLSSWLIVSALGGDEKVPAGFVVPKCTISPDGRYGVTVPIFDPDNETDDRKNSVIELSTGRVVATINTKWTGWTRMNHGGVLPCRWSQDGSLLLWTVDGKWSPDAVILLKFKNGELEWQSDITTLAEAEILKRTKASAPKKYARAKQANSGSGSAYPEGFTIYVSALDPIALPLSVNATLTADPKHIEDLPQLESHLTGSINERGELVAKDFAVGKGYWEKFAESTSGPEPCEMPEAK